MSSNRIYRRHGADVGTPGVPPVFAANTTTVKRLSGYYPMPALTAFMNSHTALQLAATRDDLKTAWDEATLDLDYRQLVPIPPGVSSTNPNIRDGFDAGYPPFIAAQQGANGSEWVFIVGNFRVPIVVPAAVGTPPTVQKGANDWSSGAVSVQSFFRFGRVKFRVQAGKQFIIGLFEGIDPTDPHASFIGLQFFGDGLVRDLERSGTRGTFDDVTSGYGFFSTGIGYNDETIFKVELLPFHDDATLNISADNLSLLGAGIYLRDVLCNWSLGALLYEPGTWVEGVEVVPYSTAGGSSTLPALAGRAGKNPVKSMAITKMPRMTGTSRVATRSAGIFPKLAARGGRIIAESYGRFMPLAGYAATLPPGTFTTTRSYGLMPKMTGLGHSIVGEVGGSAASFALLKARATNRSGADAYRTSLPALRGVGIAFPPDEGYMFSYLDSAIDLSGFETLYLLMNSGVTIAAAMTSRRENNNLMQSALTAATNNTVSAILNGLMASHVLVATGPPAVDDGEVWVVNLLNGASSTYTAYDFNSFGTLNGKAYGAREDGIYLLEGPTDAGAPIQARISYGKQDFGTKTRKHPTRAYVGASSSDRLYLKITADDGSEHVYVSRTSTSTLKQQRFDVGRGLKATYFTFELLNREGGDFDIDGVSFFAAEFTRRI